MSRFRSRLLWLGLFVLPVALLTGCGGKGEGVPTAPTGGQAPTVAINAPPNQSLLQPGQAVQVDVLATDDQGVARIELYVDNSLVESRVAPAGSALTTMRELFTWSAAIVGPHTLQARAYDAAEQLGASPIVAVQVGAQGPTQPPAVATSPPAEATAPPTAPPEASATPSVEPGMVTANVNANVRNGPGTNYYVIGTLAQGESALVTGRNADSSWWQISFGGGVGWIANSVASANGQAYNAPVVGAPPPPATNTPVPPTATPTPLAPTNTPAPTVGLWVDQTVLSAGQCTTLRWNFANIRAFYVSFGYGYDKEGQPGTGTRQVCPSVTTTYQATVVRQDGSQEAHSATISVSGSGCGDPVIKKFAPTTYEVAADKPFSIFWEVDCAKTVRFIRVGGAEEPVPGYSSKIDVTINTDTVFQLKVERNDGSFVYASFKVHVK